MASTALNLTNFAMSKGGAFTLDIPMLLSLSVSLIKLVYLAFRNYSNACAAVDRLSSKSKRQSYEDRYTYT